MAAIAADRKEDLTVAWGGCPFMPGHYQGIQGTCCYRTQNQLDN